MVIQRLICGLFGLALVLTATLSVAADFTQSERDTEFIRAAKRQDSKLNFYFGNMMPADWSFNHLGGFSVSLHREGLERTLRLVPVDRVPYADIESFRAAARKERQVVGYLSLTYPEALDSTILPPGTHLLTYDGLQLEVYDVHGFMLTEQPCLLVIAPNKFTVDPVVGSVTESPYSLANIDADGQISLAIQLSAVDEEEEEDTGPLLTDGAYQKFIISGEFPGISTDDDTPPRELAIPKDKEDE